jgi:hypothetical protein
VFNHIDLDHNGTRNKKDFIQLLAQFQGFEKNSHIVKIIDSDTNSELSLNEFLAFGRAVWDIGITGKLTDSFRLALNSCDHEKKKKSQLQKDFQVHEIHRSADRSMGQTIHLQSFRREWGQHY